MTLVQIALPRILVVFDLGYNFALIGVILASLLFPTKQCQKFGNKSMLVGNKVGNKLLFWHIFNLKSLYHYALF